MLILDGKRHRFDSFLGLMLIDAHHPKKSDVPPHEDKKNLNKTEIRQHEVLYENVTVFPLNLLILIPHQLLFASSAFSRRSNYCFSPVFVQRIPLSPTLPM